MKIALLTFECPPADYRSLSFPNKEKYCLKHGYDFLSYTERASDRPPPWDKIKYLQKHIDDYDWIFWTDSDSVVVNDDIRLETFIDTGKDLVIQLDEALDKTKAINAGQIFLKNSEWGKWFLNEVWNNEKYGTSIDDGDWEQSCIKKVIGDKGQKFPNKVRVYQNIRSGFNVVPSLATSDTFMVHFRRDHRDGYKQILKKITNKKIVNLIYIGNFSGPSGYSVAARGYFKILSNHPEINVKVLNITHGATGEEPLHLDWYIIRNESEVPKNSVVFYHIEPGEKQLDEAIRYSGINIRKIIQNARKRFILFAWEPCGVPPYWKDFFNTYFDELITFCKFQSKNISEFKEKPIHVLPHLMMLPSKINGTVSNKFRMLSMSQWSYRKGFDILIQAFLCEFFNDEDVELTIKTFGANGTLKEKETIIKEIQGYKLNCARHKKLPKCQIKLWYGGVSSSAINTLYDNTDLYVSTTRGEGFGLTVAEALWKGKRVIVPDKGGHLDYIHDNNYFIKSRLETLRCAGWSANYSSEFKLIEPDFEDTRVKLRQAYNDFKNSKQEWANKQKESTIFTKNYLSEDIIKKKLEEIIKCQINIDSVN